MFDVSPASFVAIFTSLVYQTSLNQASRVILYNIDLLKGQGTGTRGNNVVDAS